MAKFSDLPLEQLWIEILDTVKSANQTMKDANALVKGAGGLIDNVNGQVKPLSDSVVGTTDQANALLREAQARLQLRPGEPLQNLNDVLADAGRLVNNLNKDLPAILGPAVKVLAETSVAVDQAVSLLAAAQRFISPSSPVYYQLNSTLTESRARRGHSASWPNTSSAIPLRC